MARRWRWGVVSVSILSACSIPSAFQREFVAPPTATDGQITAIAFDRDGEHLSISRSRANGCQLQRLRLAGRTVEPAQDLSSCPERIDRPIVIQRSKTGESLARISPEGVRSLTPYFRAIDSFDVAPDGKEIVFAADAGNGFDVGLVSAEGGEVRWIFPDPLPERLVTWAPRGNKVTYVVEASGGAILRTVHVPTSFQLSVDFPLGSITQVAWEPKAEKFAVLVSSLDRAPRVELMRYGGEEREVLLGGESRLRGEFDRLGEALLLTPATTRYDRHYPVVVWVGDENPFAWNPSRAELHNSTQLGTVVIPSGKMDSRFWSALGALPWVDKRRVFVVYRQPSTGRVLLPEEMTITLIAPAAERRNTYQVRHDRHTVVTVPQRPPGEIEAFAAGYIRRELQRSE